MPKVTLKDINGPAETDRARGFCFTINTYTPEDITNIANNSIEYDYIIYGHEQGKKAQRDHLQGFMYIRNKQSFKNVREFFNGRAHIEIMKGTTAEAISYCMKELNYVEIGDRPTQGKRTDLEIIKYDIKKKRPMREIANKYFSQWVQYRRSFDAFKQMEEDDDRQTFLVIYYSNSRSSCEKLRPYFKGKYLKMDFTQDLYYEYYKNEYDYILVDADTKSLLNRYPEIENLNYIILHDANEEEKIQKASCLSAKTKHLKEKS